MIKYFKTAMLVSLVLFSSCSKDDDNNDPGNSGDPSELTIGTIRAKIDGTLKTATNHVQANMNNSVHSVQISGAGGPTTNILQFNLAIGDFSGAGTYDLGIHDSYGLGVNAIYQEVSLGGYACRADYPETTGKLVVTDYKEGVSIKGTFYFKGKKQGASGSGGDYIEVTEGEFYISLK
jgi:hypothetical protein